MSVATRDTALPTRAAGRGMSRERFVRGIGRAVLYLVVIVGAVVFTFPFFWMIDASVKPTYDVMKLPPVWIPDHLELGNYLRPFQELPFGTFFENTVIITLLGMTGVVASSSIVAFAFARMRFPGRDPFFVAMLATIMLPFPAIMIPSYVLYARLGLINTFLPLLIPEWLGSPFIIFLLRQYMLTIPLEMDDAARIDGCGWFGLFTRIILPMSGPALGVAAIYSFTYHWNNFLEPLLYLNHVELFTVPLGMALLNSRYTTDFGATMAIATISLIPVLIVFFTAQRHFIQGLVISGVKG
jgi:multiple sugar transport system permease protein